MRTSERFIYIAIICLVVAGAVTALWRTSTMRQTDQATASGLKTEVTRLTAEVAKLRQQATEPAPPTETPVRPAAGPVSMMTESDLRDLKQLGLPDPVRNLADDLMKRGDLIPIKGVLGGSMAFHDPSRWAFSRYWATADFDNGHIAGTAMLRYEVKQGGQITWTLMDWKRL